MNPHLYHFSEDPTITEFRPHVAATQTSQTPVVWAMDAEHSPLYYFPRDCPRVTYWALPTTTEEDRQRFLGVTSARIVAAIEGTWLERMRETRLYRYTFPSDTFSLTDVDQPYEAYISHETVLPLTVEPVGDLLSRLRDEDVELRITPSLWPLRDALVEATLHFSMIRMRNATPR